MKINHTIFKTAVILLFAISAQRGFAQNVGISSTSGFTPDASAGLDINYSNKGLLIPRVALTATNVAGPIASPVASLLVYNTATAGTSPNNVIPGYYYWSGSAWVMLSTSAQTNANWSLTGNTGTTAGTNFIGTTDAKDFVFKTNNAEVGRFSSAGSFGIGTSNFDGTNPEKLLIDGGTTTTTPISILGTTNSFLQFNIQNLSNGTGASTDIVATANNGTDNSAYINMGINSNAFPTVTTGNTGIASRANTAYLYSNAGDLVIGNGAQNKPLIFFTNNGTAGTTTAYGTERMRIDPAGNIGVNNIAPTEKLDVTGNLRFSGALMPNNNAGTNGYFLQSTGAGTPPIWINASNYIASNAWSVTGNTGTNASTNFIGTTDAVDFVLKTNAAERLRATSAGRIGINTTTPTQQLDVNGTIVASGTTYPNYAYNSANRMAFGETTVPASETGSVVQYGSGSNSRNMLFAFSKTGVNTSFLGNDGSQTMIGSEGTVNPITFRTGLVYTSANIMGTGTEAMRITADGNVGIGSSAFNSTNPEQLLVDAGTTSSFNVISGKGSINNYLQLNIQNISTGTSASSDVVASADNGTETANYIDMGINSSTNTAAIFGNANDAYLYNAGGSTGGNLYIGTSTSGKSLGFLTGGSTVATSSAANNERLRIDGNGNVGIGTTTSNISNKLTVAGIVAPSANSTYTLGTSGLRWSTIYSRDPLNTSSDRRLKTNIKNLKYGLKEALALQPVSYNWKDKNQPKKQIGLIAQDVRKIIPEVVIGNEAKETLGITYSELIPVLINAIKEQQKQIDDLKKTVQKFQK